MAPLPPRMELARQILTETPSIETEILGEQAATLGDAGREVEAALKALAEFDGAADLRPAVVRQAVDAVYAFFIQREAVGMLDHGDAIAEYHIPGEVLAHVGAL